MAVETQDCDMLFAAICVCMGLDINLLACSVWVREVGDVVFGLLDTGCDQASSVPEGAIDTKPRPSGPSRLAVTRSQSPNRSVKGKPVFLGKNVFGPE